MPEEAQGSALSKPLIDQLADRHSEIESLIRTGAKAWREATQPDRTHDWYMSVLLVLAFLTVPGMTAVLAVLGRFDSSVAFGMGTAIGALAAVLKDYLLPVGD
ncbi:MAG: hypothetical protein E6K08_09985 [Methanobacteriota archaeon]|nr:MAG: hypothetical protein E6K08_09985 [Euryarchaeota archaeon]